MYGTGEEPHIALLQSYDNLCKILRNLKDLPLTINSIQGISPVFRFTEVFDVIISHEFHLLIYEKNVDFDYCILKFT